MVVKPSDWFKWDWSLNETGLPIKPWFLKPGTNWYLPAGLKWVVNSAQQKKKCNGVLAWRVWSCSATTLRLLLARWQKEMQKRFFLASRCFVLRGGEKCQIAFFFNCKFWSSICCLPPRMVRVVGGWLLYLFQNIRGNYGLNLDRWFLFLDFYKGHRILKEWSLPKVFMVLG